ncbi:MAG: nucleotidyltransferase domain-containing protein [Candidatus Omnitrophica bacterium]|nr:nucleotidyltransferase domain-containing protein [Candidatus Omnitrophota bacterium]
MSRIDKRIQKDLRKVRNILKNKFRHNLRAIILYGSWMKGNARKDSDIDLLIIFNRKGKNLARKVHSLIGEMNSERDFSLVSASVKELEKETIPLYTAVKKEGQIIYGKVDLTLNPEVPQIKYRDFFERSGKFEKEKIKTAEYLMKKGISSGISEFCCIAAKHAIQAGLAMEGVGFSSKFCELIDWTQRYFGKELARAFRTLFKLYIKSEYKMQNLSKRENLLSIREAKRILKEIYSKRTLRDK